MKNLGLKVLSLTIALMLYLFVHSQTNATVIALVVPVELKNMPAEKMVLLPALRQAQVSIKGPSFLVREVAISSPAFHVKLPKDVGQRYEVSLSDDQLPLPPSVEVLSIQPSSMELIFDTVITRDLPVEVPRIGKLSESVRLVDVTVTPETVAVRGPETELKGVDSIRSQPIDMRTIETSTDFTVSLRTIGQYSKATTDTVTVSVAVASVSLEKKFPAIPVEVRVVNGYSYEVIPGVVDVEVTGPHKIIEKLTASAVTPFVKVEGVLESNDLAVRVDLPEGVSLVQTDPPNVRLLLKQVGQTPTVQKEK